MGNYFDNKLVEDLIMEYKSLEEGDISRDLLKNEIMTHVNEIIKRIISCYDFGRFEERDDLLQHASEACYKSIKNFNPLHPKYSSAFNWFSLTSKRSLYNYTLRKKKHRGHQDIDEFFHLEWKDRALNTMFLKEDLYNEIVYIIDRNFLGQQRLNYIRITAILINYLEKTRKFKKTDFYAWARSHGFKNADCRKYIKDVSEHYGQIMLDIMED